MLAVIIYNPAAISSIGIPDASLRILLATYKRETVALAFPQSSVNFKTSPLASTLELDFGF